MVVAVTLLHGKRVMVRGACVSHRPCFDQLFLFAADRQQDSDTKLV